MGKKVKNLELKLLKKTYHNYVVLDLETTGLKVGEDSITEIGMIKIKDDKIIDSYNTLIHPRKRIPYEITQLTHITNDMVSNAPYIEDILEEIKAFIGDNIILGHKVSIDLAFLQYHDSFFDLYYLDTLRLSRKAFPYLISCSLSALVEEFNLSQNNHRAMNDVYATKELYDYLLIKRKSVENIFNENHYIDPIDQTIVNRITIPNNNPFINQHCIVSGYLSQFSKNTANAIIEKLGGIAQDNVNQDTTLLITGEHKKGLYTKKHAKALERIANGQAITIIDEQDFYSYIHYSK